jgi:hypothetical protein
MKKVSLVQQEVEPVRHPVARCPAGLHTLGSLRERCPTGLTQDNAETEADIFVCEGRLRSDPHVKRVTVPEDLSLFQVQHTYRRHG